VSTLVSIRAHFLREISFERTITAMLQSRASSASRTSVNVVKKVKVNGQWKFCPVVVESTGRLKDRVLVNGRSEAHPEGVYYIEWRDNGRRRRQAIPNRLDVMERARLKALELEATKEGIQTVLSSDQVCTTRPAPITSQPLLAAAVDPKKVTGAARIILQGIESYLQGLIGAAVQSQLAALGANGATAAMSWAQVTAPPAELPQQSLSPNAESFDARTPNQATKSRNPIATAIQSFLKDIEPPQREPKTYSKYRLVLHKFRDTCGKQYVEDINRDDCRAFMRHLYSNDNEARTVFNSMGIVEQFLRRNGIKGLLQPGDKPKFVEGLREMYQPQEMEALFKACRPNEKVLYMFFLFTGERDQEVRCTSWSDIDFDRKRVRVTAKKRLGFKPKDKEEREIPVPALLLTALKEHKARQSEPNPHNLVFPTSNGRPDKKFENKLKTIARRLGLNCGHCESRYGNKCSEGPHCSKWFLHKFRHTFATTSLESGVSIRTLQEWLGHSDLETTMVYLKFVNRDDIHRLLDSSQMADLVGQSVGLANADAPGNTGSEPVGLATQEKQMS
jgi:integrase